MINFALKEIQSQTLLGFLGRPKYPFTSGNCFSVKTTFGTQYRIVNFVAENWEELFNRGITEPVRIKVIGEKTAIVFDQRIPPSWYLNRWCEVCCPKELLPEPQRLQNELAQERGELEFKEGYKAWNPGKTPDLRTEEEKLEAEKSIPQVTMRVGELRTIGFKLVDDKETK